MARVTLLVGGEDGRFPFSNCLVVSGARSRVLVDTGCGPDKLEPLRGRVDAIVYTHVHPDHIWGHRLFPETRTLVPAADHAYETLDALARRYAPEIVEAWLDYARTVFSLESPPRPAEPYDPWTTIRVGDVEIEAVPARGHTRGHTLLVVNGHVHLSDIDLTGFGPWYGHPESSLDAFAADMRLAAELASGARSVSTSHRERVFEPGEALRELDRYWRALCRQARAVAEAASPGPATPGFLAARGLIYRRYVPGMERVMRYFEEAMIEKILDLLAALGAARKTGRGYEVRPERLEDACTRLTGTNT